MGKRATYILFICGDINAALKCLTSIIEQNWPDKEIICFADESIIDKINKHPVSSAPSFILREADFGSGHIPSILNESVSISTGDALFFISDYVRLMPELTAEYIRLLFSDTSTGYVYGNFTDKTPAGEKILLTTATDAYDYSESSQIGPVRAVKREVFQNAGVYDTRLKFSYEYDLRLRIFEEYEPVKCEKYLYSLMNGHNVPRYELMKPIYCYNPPNQNYFRESYLNYTKETEQEFRDACVRSLKRRGSLLADSFHTLDFTHNDTACPVLSVLIPLYNRADYIGKAIDSVLAGAFQDYEVIVIDNGSTDGSIEEVEKYTTDSNVRLIHSDSRNTARALNLGIREAKGKYVCQLDSDDLYTPETLEKLYSYMQSNPDCALGVSYYDHIGPRDETLVEFGIIKHLEYDSNNLLRTDGLGAARIWHCCVLEELGGFDEVNMGSYAEDYDLELKLSEKYKVLRIPHVLYHYRIYHKQTDEEVDYSVRHRKKTFARKSAVLRRRELNLRVR